MIASVAAPAAGPPAEAPAPDGFAFLGAVDPTVRQEMRYAGPDNFTGGVVDGYEEPVCLLARPAAEALARAQRAVVARGYALTVYDCYRPQRAVDRFVRWAGDAADQRTKAAYYPRVEKDRLIPDVMRAARR